MFAIYIRIFYSFQLYLLLILLIKYNITSALPDPNVANLNGKNVNVNVIPTVSNNAWIKVTMNSGKDKLNAHHLRNIRGNIMKSAFIIVGCVCILFIIGGISSIIVYYVKKKSNNINRTFI